MAAPTIMLSCGEPSGDLYAGALTRELGRLAPGARVFGYGSQGFADAGGELIGDFRGLSVTGITEVVRVLPRTYGMYRRLVAAARERRPDVFVAIDFPDFNFRLLAALRRLRIPIVYYISPQLWAWRAGRMATMKRAVDRVLVIFPFEEEIYRRAGVDVRFVGHPLVEMMPPPGDRAVFLRGIGLDPAAPIVALLPGSRHNEIARILPTLARAVPRIAARVPGAQFVVAGAPNLRAGDFEALALAAPHRPVLVHARTDDVLDAADVVVTASGTATVQTALHEKPMVIVYRVSPMSYRLGRRFVRVSTFGMVNLIAGETIVPELIQDGCTPDAVAEQAVAFLLDRARADAARAALREVKRRLGGPGASARAAEAVLDVALRSRATPPPTSGPSPTSPGN